MRLNTFEAKSGFTGIISLPLIIKGNAISIERRRVLAMKRFVRKIALPILVVLIWQGISSLGLVASASLPSPAAVIAAWWTWVFGPITPLGWYSGTWGYYVLLSVRRVALGFLIASSVGVTFGVIVGWFSVLRELFEAPINFLRAVPMTAWMPFAVFIFGIHESAAIFLIAFGSFFPIVISAMAGAQQTPKILIRAASMLGTPPQKLLLRVVLPSALPSILTGVRVGLGLAWVLVIVAEMLAVQGGLGFALWSAYQFARLDLILAAICSVGALGLITDRFLASLGAYMLSWQKGVVAS